MKNFKPISLLIMVLVLSTPFVFGQNPNIAEIEIQTSAQCGMCKESIEKTFAFEKGVKSSSLNLVTKIVTVQYNPRKTNPAKIRTAISKTGYDADDVPADKKAYEKLPPCCKKPDDPNSRPH